MLTGTHGWGVPYGLDMMPMSDDDSLAEEQHAIVKEVKTVKKMKKKDDTQTHEKEHPLLFGVHHLSDLDTIFGLE